MSYDISCRDYFMSWHNDIRYIVAALVSSNTVLCSVSLSLASFPGLQSQLQCGGRLGKTPSYNGISLVHRLFRPSSFLSGESLGTRLEWRQVDIWRRGELQCTVRDKPCIQTSFYVGVLPGLSGGHFNKSAYPKLKIVCSEQSVLLC